MNTKKVEIISYIKGISILAIILYHLIYNFLNVPQIVKLASSFGGAGVHAFFICSGVGLYLQYLRKGMNLKEYTVKRIQRVYIPYIIVIFISFLIPFMYDGENRIIALLSHVFLFKMFIPEYEDSFGIQMWYVSTIIQFYFIYPFLLKIINKIGLKKSFILSILISFVWAIFTSCTGLYVERIWSSFFLQYLWEFVLGMLIAEKIYKNSKVIESKNSVIYCIIIFIISFSIFALMSYKGGILKNFNDVFSAISFVTLCIILYKMNFMKTCIKYLDKISYELYLLHYLIYVLVFKTVAMPQYINAIIAMVLIFITGTCYNYIINYINNIINNILVTDSKNIVELKN